MRLTTKLAGLCLALSAAPALSMGSPRTTASWGDSAQDPAAPPGLPNPPSGAETEPPPALTVTGSVALLSDYRFRGVSQSDKEVAVQGGITLNHESGLYGGFWASNLSGWGTFGGANIELDLIAGYKFKPSEAATLDVGVTYYSYPGGADTTDFFEPYVKLSGTRGPLTLTAGVAYAPAQEALGRWYFSGADADAGVYTDPGDKEDNLYVFGDAAAALPGTPLTAKAHIGYSDGNPGLGPRATSVAPTGTYFDWSLGLDATFRNLTLGVAYVDTDISERDAEFLRPSFSKEQDGFGSISKGTVVVSLTAAF